MALWTIEHHHHHDYRLRSDDPVVQLLLAKLAALTAKQDSLMIDSKTALSAVTKMTTDNASMRALLGQIFSALNDTKAQLAAALAANDAAGVAAAQADLDTIASLANTEDTAVQAAIAANQPPAATPPTTPTDTAAPAAAPADGTAPAAAPSPITTDTPAGS